MATEKDRQVFQESLKGMKAARDRFGTPMVEGEIIAYAVARNSAAHLKVGKIVKVTRRPTKRNVSIKQPDGTWQYTSVDDQAVSINVRGAEKSGDKWELQMKVSTLQNIHNAIVLTDPKQEIVDLFKDVPVV